MDAGERSISSPIGVLGLAKRGMLVKGSGFLPWFSGREPSSSAIRRVWFLFASAEGGTMPIDRLLKNKRTPEEIELLNKAFNHALYLLGVVDRNDPLCDMVARKVIEVGATGISEPREIAQMAVARISLR
jgi:hypothetical protein